MKLETIAALTLDVLIKSGSETTKGRLPMSDAREANSAAIAA